MKQNPRDEKLNLSILIPESHCSMFIGKEGKNIKAIMARTRTQVDLDTKVYENGYRPVGIKGDLDSIIYAVEQINECL
jgi:transcription antitermination factor NusA-like protein